jgi:hypothetical protein
MTAAAGTDLTRPLGLQHRPVPATHAHDRTTVVAESRRPDEVTVDVLHGPAAARLVCGF